MARHRNPEARCSCLAPIRTPLFGGGCSGSSFSRSLLRRSTRASLEHLRPRRLASASDRAQEKDTDYLADAAISVAAFLTGISTQAARVLTSVSHAGSLRDRVASATRETRKLADLRVGRGLIVGLAHLWRPIGFGRGE